MFFVIEESFPANTALANESLYNRFSYFEERNVLTLMEKSLISMMDVTRTMFS